MAVQIIALAALAAYQAFSGMKQAEQIRNAADNQRHLNEINAKFIEYDAFEAEKFGESEVAAYDPQIDAVLGQQRASMAAAGIDLSFGTAADIQEETKTVGFLNKIAIANQARSKAQGLRREARNVRMSSKVMVDQAEVSSNATRESALVNAGITGFRAYTAGSPDDLSPRVTGVSNYARSRGI